MATPKRKPAPAAKKKTAAGKAKPAKKHAAASARKPAKTAKPVRKSASAPARKPARKAAPAKAMPKKAAAPAKPARKPLKPAAVKPVKAAASPVPSSKTATATKKATMAQTSSSSDTLSRDDGRYALPNTVVINLPAGYHPTAKEEYMGPRQLAYFRAKLQKWREDLVEESKQTIDNLRDEVRDVGDEAERATRETENSLELRTRDRYRKLIAKIDKALKRIEEGRYGFCEETDEEIGLDRLEARPIATLCLDAQERWEHRQKQMGD
jgi:RNA polymerase-binding transcription factor